MSKPKKVSAEPSSTGPAPRTPAKRVAASKASPVPKRAPAKKLSPAAKPAAAKKTSPTARRAPAEKAGDSPQQLPDGASILSARLHEGMAAESEAIEVRLTQAKTQKIVAHPSVDERQKKGRVARAQTPRADLANWIAPIDRADPVALLEGQETSRVPGLIPVRHARMAASAFTFYRGAALIMAADLAVVPRTSLNVQLCGDAHLSNFGLFAAPDRSVIFDVNDFDETNPGPFEWDVKRLATSFVLAGRDNKLPAEVGRAAANVACTTYREAMASFSLRPEIDIWYARVDVETLLANLAARASQQASSVPAAKINKRERKVKQRIEKSFAKARSRDAWSAIEKITEVVNGKRQFRNEPPILTRLDAGVDATALVNALFREYRTTLQDDRQELLKRYEIIDIGHKVVGVGSVGLLAFVLLMRGRDDDDLMVLQIKQAQSSVLEEFTRKSPYSKHGHRVVAGQQLMQAASDSFLGWIDGPTGRSFYVRQLRDMKWSPDPASMTAERLCGFAGLCGHTLARAHARSGDSVAIAAYLGTGKAFDKAVTTFAMSYADQMELDFAAFTEAIASGRIVAHEDSA